MERTRLHPRIHHIGKVGITVNYKHRKIEDLGGRRAAFDLLERHDGFKQVADPASGGCVCPYCYASFYSAIDGDVLNRLSEGAQRSHASR